MWFSKSKQKQQHINTNEILLALNTNGISLTIDELIQYQNKANLINLAASKSLHGKMSGNYLARSKGRGMEFDEVRHYQIGDDIRAIDWRVTARTGKTHTKLFREEVERPVLVATDLSHTMHFGSQLLFKSIQASHVAAIVAWHAKALGDRLGGIVFNQQAHTELKPRSRQQGVLHYLHALVQSHQLNHLQNNQNLHESENNSDFFAENCARLRQLAKPGSLVYLITDGNNLDSEATRHLANISRHCELVVCLVTDPLEHALPDSPTKVSVAVTDGKNKQQLTIGDEKSATDYQLSAQTLEQNKEQLLTKSGARILKFSAGISLEQQLKSGILAWTH